MSIHAHLVEVVAVLMIVALAAVLHAAVERGGIVPAESVAGPDPMATTRLY